MDHLHSTAFQHTPLGRTILGPTQNIQAMTKADVEAYIRTHYTAGAPPPAAVPCACPPAATRSPAPRAGRMVLVASGDVDHADVVAHAEKTFASLPSGGVTAAELIEAEPSYFTGSAVNVRDPDMAQTGIAVAFKGASHCDPDNVTLAVMANLLGSWARGTGADNHSRSRLATLVASNGLADKIMGFSSVYHDTGLFGVYALTTTPGEIEDLSWCIMQARPCARLPPWSRALDAAHCVRCAKHHGMVSRRVSNARMQELTRMAYEVDEADLQLARSQTKAHTLAALSGSAGVCEDVAKQLLMYGRVMPREELFARIDAVTPAVVRDCAGRRIQDQDMAISAVGELSFLPNYNWFRRRAYWNRY